MVGEQKKASRHFFCPPFNLAEKIILWLELLLKTNYIDEAIYQELGNVCSQIRVMLIKSINTAKGDEK